MKWKRPSEYSNEYQIVGYGVPQVQKLHLRSQISDLRPQTSDLRPQTTIYVYFCPSFLDHTYKVDG